MMTFLLLASLFTTEARQAWIDRLREADQLRTENRHHEAETAYVVAREQAGKLDADELPLAITLNHMGSNYQSWGRLREAERAFTTALKIAERRFDPTSHDAVGFAIALSGVYLEQGQVSRTESLIGGFLRRDHELSSEDRAILFAELASAFTYKRRFRDAESLYLQALAVFEQNPSQEFRERAVIALSNLSTVYVQMQRFAEGERYSDRARALLGTLADPPPLLVFKTLTNAAAISARSGSNPEETDSLFQSAIALCEKTLGPKYYLLGHVMNTYGEFLSKMNRRADARMARKRARAILDSFNLENAQTIDASAFR